MSIQRNNFDLVLCNRYLTSLWGQLMLWTREPTSLYAGPTSCLPTVAVQPWGFPQRHLCTLCQQRYNEQTYSSFSMKYMYWYLSLHNLKFSSPFYFLHSFKQIFHVVEFEYLWNRNSWMPIMQFNFCLGLQQMTFLLSTLTDYRKSVMLVGENGCGKTAIINDKIRTAYSGEVAEVLSLTIQANR